MSLTDGEATILVGPNNSGKTSFAEAIRIFSKPGKDGVGKLGIHDICLSRHMCFSLAEKRMEEASNDEARVKALIRYLPIMRVDLTVEYEDTPHDLNLISPLLMDLSGTSNEVTVRTEISLTNALTLLKDFKSRKKPDSTTLRDFLSSRYQDYFGASFYKVSSDGKQAQKLEDGLHLKKIIQVDTVPAQRHVDDEEAGRAAKLSRLLHSHYTNYVRVQDEAGFQAVEDALEESEDTLTEEYHKVFEGILNRLRDFGYPHGSTRPEMAIRAEISSDTLYKDNTRIFYETPTGRDGSEEDVTFNLPEKFNGLGYKNLIYIVLKIESFRAALEADPVGRPGIHLIFIEEPEAHLHPQMQSVFVREISKGPGGEASSVQFLLSTHSSHIVADSDFKPIRYFRRNVSEVVARDLSRVLEDESGDPAEREQSLSFLKRYMKYSHCDLLFADKAILVEGQVEKLLMPQMVEQVGLLPSSENLQNQYISVLEIGGAFAHKFAPFIEFLGIPTLVISDIDSAKSDRTKCPVEEGVISTNAALEHWMGTRELPALLAFTDEEKIVGGQIRISYQTPENGRCGRSFEEAFIYANSAWITTNAESLVGVNNELSTAIAAGLSDSAFKFGGRVKKVAFALDLLNTPGWRIPEYIEDGLIWLAGMERGQ